MSLNVGLTILGEVQVAMHIGEQTRVGRDVFEASEDRNNFHGWLESIGPVEDVIVLVIAIPVCSFPFHHSCGTAASESIASGRSSFFLSSGENEAIILRVSLLLRSVLKFIKPRGETVHFHQELLNVACLDHMDFFMCEHVDQEC